MDRDRVIEITDLTHFRNEVAFRHNFPIVVEFFAVSCDSCQKIDRPIYKLAKKYFQRVHFLKVIFLNFYHAYTFYF